MMYKVIILPRAEKQMHKIKDRGLIKSFRHCFQDISVQPFQKSKVGGLKGVFGHGFNYQGTAYRVAYLIDTQKQVVYMIGLGSHEKFREEIKRYFE